MTRDEATKIADQIVIAQVGMESDPKVAAGIRLAAILIAPIVAERGMIDAEKFLALCGIQKERKSFRGQDLSGPSVDERFREIMDARVSEDTPPTSARKAALG